MSSLSIASPLARLALTLLLCVVPTLAFVGLIRGLERIRDDDLINEWAANSDEEIGQVNLADVLVGEPNRGRSDESDGRSATESPRAASRVSNPDATDSSAVRCQNCGARNPEGVTFCAECIARL